MYVTATEFKTNFGEYLGLVDHEEIVITRNGKNVAKLVSFQESRMDAVRSLRGILKGSDYTREKIRDERLAKYADEDID